MRLPLPIIQARVRACKGRGRDTACEHYLGEWQCSVIGSLTSALKKSERGLCPKGLHPDSPAEVEPASKPIRWPFARRIVHGAARLLEYAIRRCRPSNAIVEFRRRQCATCDARRSIATVSGCRLCGCLTRAKTAIATERCPKRRWAAVKIDGCGSKCGGCGHG
ncbi:MAG: hypothetical protein KF841_14125 [Phycisphaerae bacterium]|nr:hypothetical protein [Phycisphaerae bacterium]